MSPYFFAQAMQSLVFRPLHTPSFAIDDGTSADTEYFLENTRAGFERAPAVDNSCKWGAGAWLANSPDVARIGLAMIDGSLLERSTRAVIMRNQNTYRAQGAGVGGTALLFVDSESGLSVAILANTESEELSAKMRLASTELARLFGYAGR